MRISVAMATYNGETFIKEQLDSLIGQTLQPSELVVSDDGSSDATLEIIREFQQHAPFPVRILDKSERLGFADNFLHAAAACQHDLVAFCDQDDVWLPEKLEIGCRRIERDDSLLAIHPLTITDAQLNPTGLWTQEIPGDWLAEALELNPYATGWGNTMLFRRELVTLIARDRRPRQPEHPERPLSHDTWIYVLAAALGRVSQIGAPLILYRQHSDAVTGAAHPTLRQRLAKKIGVPMARMREQAIFDDRMAALFDTFAQAPANAFTDQARRAAIRFAERHDFLRTRIETFEGKSARSRLAAYRRLPHLPSDWPARRSTRLKEFVLGVAGMRRWLAAEL
jgi:hypothetical protein